MADLHQVLEIIGGRQESVIMTGLGDKFHDASNDLSRPGSLTSFATSMNSIRLTAARGAKRSQTPQNCIYRTLSLLPGAMPMSKRITADRVKLKRAYEPPAPDDGTRILIDRLWPRGIKKADAAIDEWIKEIAPSTELRKWFGHDPERWHEFRRRYQSEIRQHPEELDRIRALAQHGRITLVFSAHDEAHNDAVVLKELLLDHG